jgi:hypothetical protein
VSFELDLKAFAEKTSAKANAVVRKIVIDVGTSLVLKSPVGDADFWKNPPPPGYVGGRFRANWQYGFGAANLTTSEKIDPEGTSTIQTIVGKVGSDPAGDVHYITNSLPYSDRLENGWSRQAPQGMVGLTVLEYKPIVEAAARAVQ